MESGFKKNKFVKSYVRDPVLFSSLKKIQFVCTEITSLDSLIRLYGITKENQSICVNVDGFLCYLYASARETLTCEHLNNLISESISDFNAREDKTYVDSISLVERISLMGFANSQYSKFYKIVLKSPKYLNTCMNMLESENIQTFEGNVSFEMRFMVDNQFGGFDWLEITNFTDSLDKKMTTQIQVDLNVKDLKSLPNLTDSLPLKGVRILTFDIEACREHGFVDAKTDPIIQIAGTLFDGEYNVIDRRVFAFLPFPKAGITLPLEKSDIEVESFYSEKQMISAWLEYVVETDVDYITGYNIDGFDIPYIYQRCKELKIDFKLGRERGKLSKVKAKVFNSAATGQREDFELRAEGRSALDTLKYVKAGSSMIKLRSYSLGNVSKKLLNNSKVEMPYKNIYPYQHGTDDQRAHLCYYCWWDAELCLEIWKLRMILMDYAESSRVCKVPIKYFFSRGQQVLTQSLLLRYCQARNILVPSRTESQNDEDTAGANVFDPIKGLHTDPVITLDFQSLYPSIIRNENICYSTKVPISWAKKHLKPGDFTIPPEIPNVEYCFVKEHIWMGVLAEMESTLFNKRNEAKAEMKNEKDPEKKKVFNARQNAIKTRMNSIYGFLKANMVCDKDLMEAVTAFGRWMIKTSKELVEKEFPNAQVIYGDTDSIFVKFKGSSLKEAFELGQRAADLCTAFFNKERDALGKKGIHLLQREKGFDGIIEVGKKKYAGRKMLTLESKPELSITGLETVRRDNCLVASKTLKACLKMILMEGDFNLSTYERIMQQKEKAISFVHETLRSLLSGKTEISKLIISKNISKSFKHYEEKESCLPHIELAKKIESRKHLTQEQSYHVGDRVKYVMVAELKGTKSSACAEDPLYALTNRKNIDYNYYIENQIMKPLLRIFTPIINPGQAMVKFNKKNQQVYINDKELLALDAYKALFVGPHMNIRVQKSFIDPQAQGIAKFVKVIPSCLECGAKILGGGLPVCKSCAPFMQGTYMRLQNQMNELDLQKWAAWTKCQNCAGKHHTKIECENKDCDNFFQRMKIQVDIEDLGKKINLFF